MRNYEELLAAALATGTFADYVGDGFSVPWEVALPLSLPIGFTMLTYKAYLDFRWFPGAQLHDWCYTPYGALIGVTREEADSALFEFINRDSPVDAAIVYAAVRAGGEPFFGVSQTGYHGIQSSSVFPNIARTSENFLGEIAMATKVVMLINGVTDKAAPNSSIKYAGGQHAFGASESFWSTLSIGSALYAKLDALAIARAAILPKQCVILGFRLYNDGTGVGTIRQSGLTSSFYTLNTANDALLIRTGQVGTGSQRHFWLHYLPDGQTQNGEFTPDVVYAAVLKNYLDNLAANFSWYSQVRSNFTKIVTISAAGLVTFAGANPFAVGQFVTISRAFETATHRFRGGLYQVQTVGPLANQCTLLGWQFGACTNGAAWQRSRSIGSLGSGDGLTVERAGTKKVGRPFDLYRGRQTRRKAVA